MNLQVPSNAPCTLWNVSSVVLSNLLDHPTTKFGEKLKSQVEERLAFYETGEPTRKNIDVMKEAMAEAEFETPSAVRTPSQKKKKKRKIKESEPKDDDAEEEESTEVVKPKKKKRKSKGVDIAV